MPDEEKVTKWANLIPEVYYDLIGRVPPGTFLLVALMWVHGAFTKGGYFAIENIKNMNWAPATIFLILLLSAGYAVGMILSSLGDSFVRVFYVRDQWRRTVRDYPLLFKEFNEKFPKLSLPTNDDGTINSKDLTREQCVQLYHQLHDHLKNTNDQASG